MVIPVAPSEDAAEEPVAAACEHKYRITSTAEMVMGVSIQCLVDLVVAGISLVIGLGFFAFVASILCSAAFLHHAKAFA